MYRGFLEWAKYNVKGEDLSKDKETRVTTHNALVKRMKRLIFHYRKILNSKLL